VDAYLDVYATYVGFEAPQSSTAYPHASRYPPRLVSAKDNTILLPDRIIYGCTEKHGRGSRPRLAPTTDSASCNRGAFQTDPTKTARALQSH